MSSPDIDSQLKELIVERLFLDLDPTEIDSSTPLAEYGVDSFLLVEVIVALEEIFGVRFDQADINTETLSSIDSLRGLIESKQQG